MSQSHVAAGRYVTGQKLSGSQVGSGQERALGGLPSWGNRSGGFVTTVENLITYLQGYGAQV
jgi:hypothetical protein